MTQEGGDLENPRAWHASRPRSRRIAVLAMIASSVGVIIPPFGILGLSLGVVAKRRSERSPPGRHRLADAAIALGSITSLLTLGLFAWIIPYSAQTVALVPREATQASRVTRSPSVGAPSARDAQWAAVTSSKNQEIGITRLAVGDLVVVDLGPAVPTSLTEALLEQRALAKGRGHRMLVWVVMPDCTPCDDVEAALHEEPLQRVLGGVRLVRLNVVDFLVELTHLGVPVDVFPGFVLLGDDAEPTDYIHGGEWEDDVAENIAPVLESFIQGTYTERRHPWRGGPHDDETPI